MNSNSFSGSDSGVDRSPEAPSDSLRFMDDDGRRLMSDDDTDVDDDTPGGG